MLALSLLSILAVASARPDPRLALKSKADAFATSSIPETRSVSDDFLVQNLGNLSPYFGAPYVTPGLNANLPSGCEAEQVMLMARHGSRFPLVSELAVITGLVGKLTNASSALSSSRAQQSLPSNLQFLTRGYKSQLSHDNLTAPGRRQLFDHGVDMRLQYMSLAEKSFPITVLAGGQDRVIESAQWFQQGFFGRDANTTSKFATIAENSKTISWITPTNTCPKWQYAYGANLTAAWGTQYLPPIADRLNQIFASSLPAPGLTLSSDDVHGALYACAYDLAYFGAVASSPWCAVFSQDEILDFQYELDLLLDGAFGYDLPNMIGQVTGALYTRTLVDRFTNASGNAVPMYLEFGHDTTIDLALTGLGLVKDVPPLSANVSRPDPGRQFRTDYQVPFAAKMVWEKFSCSIPSPGLQTNTSYIRLVLNDAPFSLAPLSSACAQTGKQSGTGACTLADFVKAPAVATAISTNGTWGSARWNATCGNPMI